MEVHMTTAFKVLNGLDIEQDGRTCALPPPKVRQLVATFIAFRRTPASPEALIDELWGERPPPSAQATLQAYVYQLRKFIARHGLAEPGKEMVTTGPAGYVLDIAPEQVDEWHFEQLVHSGTELVAQNDLQNSAQQLRHALSMGRGAALAGVTRGPIVEAYALSLNEQHTNAAHLCIQTEMRCGGHAELVNELRSLTLRHPLDEGFHQFLIEALSKLGRRADALQAFQKLRTVLHEELGLDPSSAACSLQARLLHD
jgi:SARP family transcriptional regulator, regulator of embCAB operon